MSSIGLRNQDQPNRDDSKPPENPAYPSGVSPSRTMKTPDNYALRTTLSGKVSFVSAYVTEGMPMNAQSGSVLQAATAKRKRKVQPTVSYGMQRSWVVSYDEPTQGRNTEHVGKQTFAFCNTNIRFNKRYTEECKNQGLRLIEHEQLRIEARNSNAYGNVTIQQMTSRLVILYLEPNDTVVDGFAVQVLRVDDNSMPLHFEYAKVIVGRTLEQLSFDQEQRYMTALEKSKVIRKQDWQHWDAMTQDDRDKQVSDLLKEFNNGATINSIK